MDKKIVIASAAAALFALGAVGTASADGHSDGQVKCVGANGCKGQGECHTASHDCGGKNECKGKGWVHMTEAECKDAGGTLEES